MRDPKAQISRLSKIINNWQDLFVQEVAVPIDTTCEEFVPKGERTKREP